MQKILYGTFTGCSNLYSIEIPNSVVSIGSSAFNGCDKLTNVYYKGNEEEWGAISIASYNVPLSNAVIHYN